MSFSIKTRLVFINSSQSLSSSLESLVKNLSENEFFYLSQQFDIQVLH